MKHKEFVKKDGHLYKIWYVPKKTMSKAELIKFKNKLFSFHAADFIIYKKAIYTKLS